MKTSEISFEEQRAIQLDMLKEIDSFCRDHNIRYSLAYGTLLGAIRHKGYIPWDDDIDIIMPIPDMLKFKEQFVSENLKYCDIDTEPHFENVFSNVSHKLTYRKRGLIGKIRGICVDLYPVVGTADTKEEIASFFEAAATLQLRRTQKMVWQNRLMKVLPIHSIPGFDESVSTYRNFVLNKYPYEGAKNYFHVGGPLKWYEIFDYDVFEKLIDVDFEGCRFWAIDCYDDYLKQVYGNYLQLPPEDQRHPSHGQHYYWK